MRFRSLLLAPAAALLLLAAAVAQQPAAPSPQSPSDQAVQMLFTQGAMRERELATAAYTLKAQVEEQQKQLATAKAEADDLRRQLDEAKKANVAAK
jgi:hypothetical protein